jgi:acetyltransferase-like isoleucine patch superfamily enzyme
MRLGLGYRAFGIGYVCRDLERAPAHLAARILREYGATVGKNVNLKGSIQIDNASGDEDATGDFSNLHIGDRCYIGKGVFFDLPAQIVLEDEVIVSAGVKFLTHSDCGQRVMRQWYPRRRALVRIGYGSWIGANALIMSGVTLGECCVVGAGAVVTHSYPARSVIAGVPARLVKTLAAVEH